MNNIVFQTSSYKTDEYMAYPPLADIRVPSESLSTSAVGLSLTSMLNMITFGVIVDILLLKQYL